MISVIWLVLVFLGWIWGVFDWRVLVTGLVVALIIDFILWVASHAGPTDEY